MGQTSDTAELCAAAQSQLLVIDVQQRLQAAMKAKITARVTRHIERLIRAAHLLGIPVHHTEQYPRGLGETLPELQALLPGKGFEKTCFSCCGAEGLSAALEEPKKGRGQIVLCGMESHVCVLQTALELQAQGFAVFVVEDACCSRDKHHHKNAMARLRTAGVVVSNHESVLFEWLRDASHPHFRAISAMLRAG